MHLDLSELSQLAPIFRELFKGYHVSRRDPELYAQLSNFQDQYRTLFKALGFELVCDTRGFYYFVPDTAVAAAQALHPREPERQAEGGVHPQGGHRLRQGGGAAPGGVQR